MTQTLVQPTQDQIDFISKKQDDGWFMCEGPTEWDSLGTPGGVYGVVVTLEMKSSRGDYFNHYWEVIIEEDGTPHTVS